MFKVIRNQKSFRIEVLKVFLIEKKEIKVALLGNNGAEEVLDMARSTGCRTYQFSSRNRHDATEIILIDDLGNLMTQAMNQLEDIDIDALHRN